MGRFFDWIFDVDNCRSHPALLSSMTGEVLVRSSGGRGFYTTETGRKRAGVAHAMMLGDNAQICKAILKGEFDFCLTNEDKSHYVEEIREAVEFGGQYRDVKRDRQGHLYFPKAYWSKSDLKEISYLLEKLNEKVNH